MKISKIILGIDHGLHHMGWAVIEDTGTDKPNCVDHNVFHTKKSRVQPFLDPEYQHSLQLNQIYQKMNELLQFYSPHVIVLEDMLLNKNPKTSLILSMARGGVLSAIGLYNQHCIGVEKDILVRSYKPNVIKQRVCGHGHALKHSMADMLKLLFNHSFIPNASTDATDAVVIALCYFFEKSFKKNLL